MGKFSVNMMANYLAAGARYDPRGEVLTFGDQRLDRATLKARVFRLAQALLGLGVEPSDKVAFMFHNTPQFVELNYAVQVAGAIPVPINYRFTAAEVQRQVDHCDARLLVYDTRWQDAVQGAAPGLSQVQQLVAWGADAAPGALDYEQLLAAAEDADPAVPTGPDDVAAMIYTGGTTGFPKGVMLTYGAHLEMFTNLLASIVTRGAQLDLSMDQVRRLAQAAPLPVIQPLLPVMRSNMVKRVLGHPATFRLLKQGLRRLMTTPQVARFGYSKTLGYMVPSLPFFHDAGYMLLMLGPMVGNLRYVIPTEVSFDPLVVLQTIARERPFLLANVPTGWKKLVTHPRFAEHDVSSVAACISGAGVCPVALKRTIFERFSGTVMVDMFGQTEMTPLTAFRIDVGPDQLKERSVGRPIVDVRVLDEQGRDLPAGEVGEIVYRSDSMMKGYYKEQASQAAGDQRWFHSGDLGYLDDDGEIRVVDRKNECINTGGEKVSPLEVEDVLHQHPGVEAACVIGVPDEQWGHTIRAVVQPRAEHRVEQADLLELAREQLAGYKVPRSVVFVDQLPLSPVGKVLRSKIRDRWGEP